MTTGYKKTKKDGKSVREPVRAPLRAILDKFGTDDLDSSYDNSKFSTDLNTLITGQPDQAALGVFQYLRHPIGAYVKGESKGPSDYEVWTGMGEGIEAIKREIEQNGTATDKECLDYVLNGKCPEYIVHNEQPKGRWEGGSNEKPWPHAGDRRMDVFDDPAKADARAGKSLGYFVNHESSKKAQLVLEHVVAIRLYTTAAFPTMNDPLRWGGKAHPLPITIAFLTDGIKKLRAVGAHASDAHEAKDFFRGMRGLQVNAEFLDRGGTEKAPMSTSSELSVALQYSGNAETRLIFKVVTSSFIERGASLQYLSAFPGEVE